MRRYGLAAVPLTPPPPRKQKRPGLWAWLVPDPASFWRSVLVSVTAGLIVRSLLLGVTRRRIV